ncbi:MAG: hypothetical protein ACP5RP_01950 [Candidatus Micrarchaeia archaeon]
MVLISKVVLSFALLAIGVLSFSVNAVNATGSLPMNISVAINTTSAYIQKINESGYFIFYPNMSVANSYLTLAKKSAAGGNYTQAFSYLKKSEDAATAELQSIDRYKGISLAIMATGAVVFGALLYHYIINKAKKLNAKNTNNKKPGYDKE